MIAMERQAAAYLWQVPGKPVAVRLDNDAVDRLVQEVMQGFGLIPRKSVEVGGLLLGSARQEGSGWVVSVTDFEPVACRYARGTTWQLDPEEEARFEETLGRWGADGSRGTYAVGWYRSHGRAGLSLAEEDLERQDRYFPEPWGVALLVKPYATRPCTGGIFIREDGQVQGAASYLEFTLRRNDSGGAPEETGPSPQRQAMGRNAMTGTTVAMPVAEAQEAPKKKLRSGWVWLPLSFIFLLLGVILGFQLPVSMKPQFQASAGRNPFAMHLDVAPSGDTSLHVQWDRSSPAIQAASSGVLHIADGGASKEVKLDAAQLHNGSVVYRKATDEVTFRLEVTAQKVSISETVRYRKP